VRAAAFWSRLAAAAALVAAGAFAQAPTLQGRSLAANGRSLTAYHLSGSPVTFGEARVVADALGLDYARGRNELTFTLGPRTVTVPLAVSLQVALRSDGISVDGRPVPGPAGAVSAGRVLVPLQPLAAAVGASFTDDGRQARLRLPEAAFEPPLRRVTSKEADRVVLQFSRMVNYRSELDGNNLVVTVPYATGENVRYSVDGGTHIKEVVVAPSKAGFQAKVALKSQDGYRVWASEQSVVIEAGPALKRTPAALSTREITVVIDPGHGGEDPGASGGGLLEKDVTLDVANAIRAALAGKGVTVRLTRLGDTNPNLATRQRSAAASDVFVSLHASSLAGSSASGVTIYFLAKNASTPAVVKNARGELSGQAGSGLVERFAAPYDASVQLADTMSGHLVGKPGLQARTESYQRLGDLILGAAPGRAVLVNVGWLSDAEDQRRLSDPAELRKLGQYLAAGILEDLAPLIKARKAAAQAAPR
jgi:N-acetylmuramoyl-L-alanine amidase